MGIYRAPNPNEKQPAVLPYVYLSPLPDSILMENDKLYVFSNPVLIQDALEMFKIDLVFNEEANSYCLGDVAKGIFIAPPPLKPVKIY
jgi:hypothetical protein